jgi:hypothetical protein
LENLRKWWDTITEFGPHLGYFPKPSKSWLVVKESKLEEAKIVFRGTGVNITTEGRKYLGGFVGTREGAEKYVGELVEDWVEQLKELSRIAKAEPQAAYSAFTAGFRHKLTYFMRTIPDLMLVLKPVDEIINKSFIPSITEGHVISSDDRKLLSLPVKLGGMGIPIFTEICQSEYENSLKATQLIRPKIVAQETSFTLDRRAESAIDREIRKERDVKNQGILEDLRLRMSKDQTRGNDISQMKGGSSWLTALPLKEEGFVP